MPVYQVGERRLSFKRMRSPSLAPSTEIHTSAQGRNAPRNSVYCTCFAIFEKNSLKTIPAFLHFHFFCTHEARPKFASAQLNSLAYKHIDRQTFPWQNPALLFAYAQHTTFLFAKRRFTFCSWFPLFITPLAWLQNVPSARQVLC